MEIKAYKVMEISENCSQLTPKFPQLTKLTSLPMNKTSFTCLVKFKGNSKFTKFLEQI